MFIGVFVKKKIIGRQKFKKTIGVLRNNLQIAKTHLFDRDIERLTSLLKENNSEVVSRCLNDIQKTPDIYDEFKDYIHVYKKFSIDETTSAVTNYKVDIDAYKFLENISKQLNFSKSFLVRAAVSLFLNKVYDKEPGAVTLLDNLKEKGFDPGSYFFKDNNTVLVSFKLS